MGTVKLKDFRSAVLASQTEALAKLRDISMGKLHETYWHAYEQQLREAGRLLQVIDANPDAAIASLSAPQPPAEAQPVGTVAVSGIGHTVNWKYPPPPIGTPLYAHPPPSAPVGQLTYKGVPIGPMQTFADFERQAIAWAAGQQPSAVDGGTE